MKPGLLSVVGPIFPFPFLSMTPVRLTETHGASSGIITVEVHVL